MRCALLLSSLSLLTTLLAPSAARAEVAPAEDPVMATPHLLSAEVGPFWVGKQEGTGVGIGAGYAYRLLKGLDLGVGLRYLVIPSHDSDTFMGPPAPLPGEPAPPPERYVYPTFRLGFVGVSVRGFVPLDSEDRFELGLTARAGFLAMTGKTGLCCTQIALAPDLRMKLAGNTALQLAPEAAIGTTGDEDSSTSDDHVNEFFLQYAVWLSVVQAF
jgi:hypothetical protein